MIPEAKLSNYMKTILKPCVYTLLTRKTANLKDLQNFLSEKEGGFWSSIGK